MDILRGELAHLPLINASVSLRQPLLRPQLKRDPLGGCSKMNSQWSRRTISRRWALGALASSLAYGQAQRTAETPPTDKSVTHAATNPSGLVCAPQELKSGDTLRLELSVPHGPYLVVQAPDGAQLFVVYPGAGPAKPSLVSEQAFAVMPHFTTPVAELRGWPWIYGRDTLEPVFYTPGDYQVIVAQNWESENAYDIRRCYVHYHP
jgi:hypothetical protein